MEIATSNILEEYSSINQLEEDSVLNGSAIVPFAKSRSSRSDNTSKRSKSAGTNRSRPFSAVKNVLIQEENNVTHSIASFEQQTRSTTRSSFYSEDLELTFTISGANTSFLNERESLTLATHLRIKHQSTKAKLKAKYYADKCVGKYVSRLTVAHKWKSLKAKREDADYNEVDDDDEENLPYKISLIQGLKCQYILRRPQQITTLILHAKIPTHYQDGSLAPELANDVHRAQEPKVVYDEEEDLFAEKDLKQKTNRNYMLDSKRYMTIWDITSKPEAKFCVKMNYEISYILFLTNYYLYAGLVNLDTIKFFNSKLEITSSVKADHSIQKGALCIHPKLRLTYCPIFTGDHWISVAELFEKDRQLCIVVNTNLYLYDLERGQVSHSFKNLTRRTISSVCHHMEYQFLLVGSVDGTSIHIAIINHVVSVINTVRATVHEFVSHSKSVVGMVTFQKSPLFASCGLDNTLKIYNLKYFKEVLRYSILKQFTVTSIHLKDKPVEIKMIDESLLYIRTRKTIEMWMTNQFNLNFTSMSSQISRLIYSPGSTEKPSRIICRSVDGVNRIISPITGRSITANLPLLETDTARDVAYMSELGNLANFKLTEDRLFVLLESGEIWIFRTNQNPFTIVDIWNSMESKNEDCTHLIICEGEFLKDDLPACPPQLKRFGILLIGTKNGHLLIMGKGGAILDRYQLHMGAITQILYDETTRTLVSGGLDEHIRVAAVNPFDPDIIQIKIDIQMNYVPRVISCMGNIIAVASDDATIHMFEVNRVRNGHAKSHDHTQRVIAICSCKAIGVFCSIGNDNNLRIWNFKNKLLREIHFQEPLESICLANEKGDLLLGMGSRIDLLKSTVYLPPSYLSQVSAKSKSPKKAEVPLVFDDSLIPFTRGYAKDNAFRWFERVSNIRRQGIFENGRKTITSFDFNPGADSNLEIFLRELQSTVRSRHLKQFEEEENKLVSVINHKPLVEETTTTAIPSAVYFSEESSDSDSDEPKITDKPAKKKGIPTKLYIAPDGVVPNSRVGKEVHKWLVAHGRSEQVTMQFRPKKKEKAKAKKNKKADKDAKSQQYKEKLKMMMKKLIEEQETEEIVEEVKEVIEEAPPEEIEEHHHLRIGTVSHQVEIELEPIEKEIVEIILPLAIERLMNYEWFPEDQIFHNEGYQEKNSAYVETIVKNSKGKIVRTPKIGGSPEELIPILVGLFPTVHIAKRAEVLHFIKWLHTEIGIKNTTVLEDFICRKISQMKFSDTEDVRLRIQMMDLMSDIHACTNTEYFLGLLCHTGCLYDNFKFKLLHLLKALGVPCIEHPFMITIMEGLAESARAEELTKSISYQDTSQSSMKKILKEYLQNSLHRFLMNSTTDQDLAKTIQSSTIYGEIDPNLQSKKKKKGKKVIESKAVEPVTGMIVLLKPEAPVSDEPFRLPERNFSCENINSFCEKAVEVADAVVNLRTEVFPSILDSKQMPTSSMRDPLVILKDPQIIDYINAVNYLLFEERLRLKEEEIQRQERIRLQKIEEEVNRKIAAERADAIAKKARLAAERQAIIDARKERQRAMREAKKAPQQSHSTKLLHPRKIKLSEMSTQGVGKTHVSCCHESREHLDVTLRFFPPLNYQTNNSLTVHLKTMNKSMPMEHVRLQPFEEVSSSTKNPKNKRGRTRGQEQLLEPISGFDQVDNEINFIRGITSGNIVRSGTANDVDYHDNTSFTMFQPGRKYFIPQLSIINK
ncbi:WD repeat-containing protein 87 [Globomyces sp. JEL0801]|nr:WD repeat-containing protein 87 [Globomyces sp. JEL0801]